MKIKAKIKKYILLFVFLFAGIIYGMGLFNWGSLPKAQDNAQTIDEAITAAISAHEIDPTAHLGEGESLQQHKNNEIIDHPAQSIVADKEVFGLYDETVALIGGYIFDADTGSLAVNVGRTFYVTLASQTAIDAHSDLAFDSIDSYPIADLILRFQLYMSGASSSNGSLKLYWSADNNPTSANRIEFIKEGTAYYFRIYLAGVKVKEVLLQTGGVYNHFVGVYFDSTNENVDLYVDGNLSSSYHTTSWHDLIFYTMSLYGSRTTNTSLALSVGMWKARYILFVN